MALKFYGKKSCITCQKAKVFLESQNVPFEEIPIENQPPDRAVLNQLVDPANVKASLNIRSAIYKEKNMGKNPPDAATVVALMLKEPNLIKRPVIVSEQGKLYQGFNEETLLQFLNS